MDYSSVVLMITLASYFVHTSSIGIEIEALKAFKSLIHLHHCNWSVVSISLSDNQLTVKISPYLGNLSNLQILNLGSNSLSASFLELGLLTNLQVLDLSKIGSIPEELCELSNNNLSGSIPLSLRRCRILVLRSPDRSCYILSGRIPNSFTNFTGLKYLNLSFNHLEGPVPTVGIFQILTFSSLNGNLALCGTNLVRSCHKIDQPTDPHGFVLFVCTILTCGNCFGGKQRRKPRGEFEYIESIPKKFSQDDLKVATDSFHRSNLIDQRELSTIYKGIVLSRAWNERTGKHQVVAVKRWDLLQFFSTESDNCFLRELSTSNHLRHRNLVKLIGYSSESGFKATVLEYMENGSLESIIHNPNTHRSRWTFSERLRVCVSVANALVYMHSEYGDPIVHGNLKPSNVLFDGDWEAHLNIFGTSRMLGINVPDGSSRSASASQGRSCYLAPEFGHTSTVTTKADVYSFGILVIEFLTTRRPTETIEDDEFPNPVTLREFVNGVINLGFRRLLQLLDPDFASSVSIQQEEDRLMDLFQLALSCTRHVPEDRPEMTEVMSFLVKLRIV